MIAMLCFRCGSPVEEEASTCENCGQDLATHVDPDRYDFSELQRKIRQSGRDWIPVAYRVGEVVRERYEIADVLASGSLGTLYKAIDQETETDVALKAIDESEYLFAVHRSPPATKKESRPPAWFCP